MTVECYYGECEFHSSKFNPDEGPFCDEPRCKATEEQIVVFQENRTTYLKSIRYDAGVGTR